MEGRGGSGSLDRMNTWGWRVVVAGAAALGLSLTALAQPDVKADPGKDAKPADPKAESKPETKAESKAAVTKALLAAAISRGTQIIVAGEEAGQPGEWPYEGVYRENGKIPIGYRVGGTAICAGALVRSPGYEENQGAKDAAARGLSFILKALDEPLMAPDYDSSYDVRGWGYTYALQHLLFLKDHKLVPEGKSADVERAIGFCIDSIQKTEIPQVGGWNYARPGKKEGVSPPSPFMTAPTLQALFEAKRQGYKVDAAVVGRALDFLESGREPSGGVAYSGAGANRKDGVPGAVGRMLATESVLYLAGRSTQANVRAAVDAFIVHWDWLDQRRAKTGTHIGPYQIAPYYFYYAHFYAAQAVELLPEHERAEYRRRINELLFRTRAEDGAWNDRVFKRSANYGTAMAVLAMLMPETPRPAGWEK